MGYLKESYSFGATAFHVGLSAVTSVNPPPHAVGGWIQQQSAGTLWLSPGITMSMGATQGMWLNTSTNPLEYYGPNKFFLFASGATVTVGLGFKYSEGVSFPLAGE